MAEFGLPLLSADISFGTPPQPIDLALDLQETRSWIPSASSCNTSYPTFEPSRCYNSTESSTYTADGTESSVRWNFEGYDGFLSQDHMSLGEVQIQDRVFTEWTKRLCLLLGCIEVDGVLGLARPQPSSTASPEETGILQFLSDQSLLSKDMFSLHIPRYLNQTGELRFGSTNTNLHNADFARLSLTPPPDPDGRIGSQFRNTWTVPFKNVSSVPAVRTNHTTPSDAVAFIDSFAPFITLPDTLAQNLFTTINSTADRIFRYVDCDKRNTMPNLSFELGDEGYLFNVTAFDYIYELKFGDIGPHCIVTFIQEREYFGPSERSSNVTILGQPFLKAFYSVFDWVDESISREYTELFCAWVFCDGTDCSYFTVATLKE